MIKKCLVPVLLILAFVMSCSRKPTVEGTYLVNGISGLVSIETKDDSLIAKLIKANDGFKSPRKIVYQDGILFLVFMQDMGYQSQFTAYKLIESKDEPGDWDLLGITKYGFAMDEEKAFSNTEDLAHPFPSFLHRVDDPNLESYFNSLGMSYETESTCDLEKAEEILRQHPQDPYYRILYLDALMRKEKWQDLQERLSEWQKGLEDCPNPTITYSSKVLSRAIEGQIYSSKDQNAWDYIMRMSSMKPEDSYESLLEKAVACLGNIADEQPPSLKTSGIVHFLPGQICAKVLRMESIFAMIKGDYQRALHLLTLTYRLGQIYRGNPNMISNLVGIAVWVITESGMELYILNACKIPDDAREFFMNLEELRKKDQELHYDDYLEHENPISAFFAPESLVNLGEEVKTRWNVGEAKANLLLCAAAARYRLLKTGEFPASSAEFAPLLETGLPEDPFIKEPIHFIKTMDSFFLYSVGPDQKDDSAVFPYDPTNGTISAGDIFIEIPPKPKFPFPEKGRLATTKEGLLRQFPNGLPPDAFHDNRNAPLTIIDSIPAKIISFGPDTDSSRANRGELLPLDPPYDPTNGTVSNGDLILDTLHH